MFPWTSELSGFGDTHSSGQCPPDCDGLDWKEQHITGDIAMAFRLHWRTHGDRVFLNQSWPLIHAVCEFWASRLVKQHDSGNWTVKQVVGPDEPAGVHDDEVYTNAIAASSFLFGIETATVLGLPVPPEWSGYAAAPHLPLSSTLSPGTLVHPEYAGYDGAVIMQSSVALLQYPLLWDIPAQIKRNDLEYYERRTKQNGFFTGDSVYSIAWLALGNATKAKTQWDSAFAHMDTQCFFTFHEMLRGGHLNFITGAGGFLQNVMQGFSGIRVHTGSLDFQTPVLPTSIRDMTLNGLRYQVAQ